MPEEINAQPPWLDEAYPALLRQTAEALGFLVMMWGHLEGELNSVVIKLLKTSGVYYEIVGHIDFREKLQIIKSIAFVSIKDSDWFDRLEILSILLIMIYG